jgi:hypothetical protein
MQVIKQRYRKTDVRMLACSGVHGQQLPARHKEEEQPFTVTGDLLIVLDHIGEGFNPSVEF